MVGVSKILVPCMLGIALSGAASAEVYESKDAQGNTVFSDRPSQGATEVKLPPTNAADPVAITPRPTPSPETPAKPRKSPANPAGSEHEEWDDDDIYYGGDYGRDEINDQTRQERRRDDGEARPKTERPTVAPHRNVSRPAGGGGGRR
jgi:Domain of unknown function (DUF4124)